MCKMTKEEFELIIVEIKTVSIGLFCLSNMRKMLTGISYIRILMLFCYLLIKLLTLNYFSVCTDFLKE
jgi:hypothetical protein